MLSDGICITVKSFRTEFHFSEAQQCAEGTLVPFCISYVMYFIRESQHFRITLICENDQSTSEKSTRQLMSQCLIKFKVLAISGHIIPAFRKTPAPIYKM